MHTIEALNERCALGSKARWKTGPGGLAVLQIHTDLCEGQLFAYGAQVTSWKPQGQRELLFLSEKNSFAPGKAIRGGIPICFPWFGPRFDDPRPGDKPSPQHGFARNRAWDPVAVTEENNGNILVECALPLDVGTRALWKHAMDVRLFASFGSTLEVRLTVKNLDSEPFRYEDALHTYLSVQHAASAALTGFSGLPFLDKVDGGKRKAEAFTLLSGETDRVFVNTEAPITIWTDKNQVRVEKSGSHTTVLWNPWREKTATMADLAPDDWQRFVCIEAANAGENSIVLAPNETHSTAQRFAYLPS